MYKSNFYFLHRMLLHYLETQGKLLRFWRAVQLIFGAWTISGGKESIVKLLEMGAVVVEWWQYNCNRVGILVATWLVKNTVEVERASKRVTEMGGVIGDNIWEVVLCYYIQVWRSSTKQDKCCELVKRMLCNEKVLVSDDFKAIIK